LVKITKPEKVGVTRPKKYPVRDTTVVYIIVFTAATIICEKY